MAVVFRNFDQRAPPPFGSVGGAAYQRNASESISTVTHSVYNLTNDQEKAVLRKMLQQALEQGEDATHIDFLVRKGAPTDNAGPLVHAIKANDFENLDKLLTQYSFIFSERVRQYALVEAVQSNVTKAVTILLNVGKVDPNFAVSANQSCNLLYLARENTEIYQLLLEHGADPNAALSDEDANKRNAASCSTANGDSLSLARRSPDQDLTPDEIERYSRQLILSQGFGVAGQRKLLSSSVLVIGAGGIGSTLLLYLATAGVGRLGIVDFDNVEISNLHRQVIHRTDRVGQNKAASAVKTLRALNPSIAYATHECQIDADNALELVQQYDCVVDCSDNPRTRYLVNDACVLANRPLVSGSAVGLEGQITVYNYENGPCYRCLYPRPSATTGCRACADAGVFGPVPGLIGILQATETIKVLTKTGTVLSNHLLMYDSMRASFLSIKKPPKRPKCPLCGPAPTIRSMSDSRETLLTAMGPKVQPTPALLADELSVTCQEYNRVRQSNVEHILLDVRVKEQYDLCHLPDSVHLPLEQIAGELDRIETISNGKLPIYCLCRRGIASVEATRILHEAKVARPGIHSVRNITGGLDVWREAVDSSFPKY